MDSTVRPTPRNGYLGWIADKVGSTNDFLNQTGKTNRPGSTGNTMGIGNMLGLGALSRVTDRASYGDSPFIDENESVRSNLLPTFKPGRYEDVRDAAMALAPVAGKMAPAVRGLVENGALDYGKGALSEMLKGTPPTSMKYQQGAIKPKGGNWVNSSVDNYIDSLEMRNYKPETTQWANSNLKKYIKNEMGTENDPMFNHDDIHLPYHDLIHNSDRLDVYPDVNYSKPTQNILSQKAYGLNDNLLKKASWENLTDSMIEPKTIPLLRDEYKEPWMENAPKSTLVNRLKSNLYGSDYGDADPLGFSHLLDHIDRKLTSGELSPEDLKRSPVDLIAKQMGDERVRNEQYVVPTPTKVADFPSGNSMVKLDKPGQFAKESDAMSHSVRGYEPTDGTIGAGKGGHDNYGTGTLGYGAIQNGTAEVHSLRDPNGISLATIESKYPDKNKEGKGLANPIVSDLTQVKGPNNNPIDPQHMPDVIDYLNNIHSNSGQVNTRDLTANNITDTSKFPSQWSHEPEFVDKLNDVTGGKRFVDSNTVKQVYDDHMGSKNDLGDVSSAEGSWQPEPEQNIPPNQ